MNLDLEISQGDTFILPLIWQDASKVPIDITGRQARMHIRSYIGEEDYLLELTTENGRIQLGGIDGTVNLKLTAYETAQVTWDSGVYDLELYYDDSGEEHVEKLIRGSISVIKEVTRVPTTLLLTTNTFIEATTEMSIFG